MKSWVYVFRFAIFGSIFCICIDAAFFTIDTGLLVSACHLFIASVSAVMCADAVRKMIEMMKK